MEKKLPISLKLSFTPNTLGGYGLISDQAEARLSASSHLGNEHP